MEDHFTIVQFRVPGTPEANSGDLIFVTRDLNYKRVSYNIYTDVSVSVQSKLSEQGMILFQHLPAGT